MESRDAVFSGTIAQFYERYIGSMFVPYATDIVRRVSTLTSGSLLEVAAGTGIVTQALARSLPASVSITATDLSQGMLDFAINRPGLERVSCQQADAQSLPFGDESFEVVVCQFGVMFFPDRRRAYAEARRVLRSGGRYIFSVWGSLEQNPDAEVVEQAVQPLYPGPMPGFLRRTPFGYYDPDTIREDLRSVGFDHCRIEVVTSHWQPASARDIAVGYCHGTPLRAEIEAANGDIAKATDAAEVALAARFGADAPSCPRLALVIEASK